MKIVFIAMLFISTSSFAEVEANNLVEIYNEIATDNITSVSEKPGVIQHPFAPSSPNIFVATLASGLKCNINFDQVPLSVFSYPTGMLGSVEVSLSLKRKVLRLNCEDGSQQTLVRESDSQNSFYLIK